MLELALAVRFNVPLLKMSRDQSGVVVIEPVVTVPPLIVRLLELFQTVILVVLRMPPFTLRTPNPPAVEVDPPTLTLAAFKTPPVTLTVPLALAL